jgi:hypothetical protein
MKDSSKKKVNGDNSSSNDRLSIEKEILKSYFRVLLILIIALILIDGLVVFYYVKPDFNFNFGGSKEKPVSGDTNHTPVKTGKCEDGTPNDSCSSKKPYFCYEGSLLKKAASCGCPSGYKVSFQDCAAI